MQQPTLLVFADDWGRHPSSCQHLISQLLPRYQVVWVNTIGMRPPRMDWTTLQRGVEKLRHWTNVDGGAASVPENLTVVKPLMWPWFRSARDRAINLRLLSRQLSRRLAAIGGPVVAVSTLPITADLVGTLPVERWVYYCVDDFSKWPGLDQAPLERMERDFILRADAVIAAGRNLQRQIAQCEVTAELLTHGVDLEHWNFAGETGKANGDPSSENGDRFSEFERPLIGFWGLVDRRMDVELLRRLSDRMSQGTIALVGPESDPDPELLRIPRVRRVPALPYRLLPSFAKHADVLIMPYADLPVTRAMQPLKLLEYLATGKPVVVPDLPATHSWKDCLDVAKSADEFCAAVACRLDERLPPAQAVARRRLASESWQAKAAMFERILLGRAAMAPAGDAADEVVQPVG